jgi:hypothetical protein
MGSRGTFRHASRFLYTLHAMSSSGSKSDILHMTIHVQHSKKISKEGYIAGGARWRDETHLGVFIQIVNKKVADLVYLFP